MKLEFTGSPLEYAKSVTATELKKTIKSIKKSKSDEYTDRCRICFEKFLEGEAEQAAWWSRHAEIAKRG